MSGGTTPVSPSPDISHASLYSCLLTRQTGRAVRLSIERQLAERSGPVLTVLDFSDVAIIDFSCADEVVAKLAQDHAGREASRERYFLFVGMDEHHVDPVESSLRRRTLAVAAELASGASCLLGDVGARSREVWKLVCRNGGVRPDVVATELKLPSGDAGGVLRRLYERRLVLRRDDEYVSLHRALEEASRPDRQR